MLQCILLLCTKVFLKKYILYTVLYFVCLSVYLSGVTEYPLCYVSVSSHIYMYWKGTSFCSLIVFSTNFESKKDTKQNIAVFTQHYSYFVFIGVSMLL